MAFLHFSIISLVGLKSKHGLLRERITCLISCATTSTIAVAFFRPHLNDFAIAESGNILTNSFAQ